MSPKEAKELIYKKIKKVPLPSYQRWKVDLEGETDDVWINGKDYVLFELAGGYITTLFSEGHKKIDTYALAGAFISTVDLTPLNCKCYHYDSSGQNPIDSIEQGYYRVEISKNHIRLLVYRSLNRYTYFWLVS